MSTCDSQVILVADDDPGIHDTLHLVLDDEYCVLDAYDGVQALELSRKDHVDLILLDILMPRLDGLSVLEQLGSNNAEQRVILLTGLHRLGPAVTGMKLGALDYVTKPFDPDDLVSLVKATLEQMPLEPLQASRRSTTTDPPAPEIELVGVELGVRASLAVLLSSSVLSETSRLPFPLRTDGLTLKGDVIVIDLSDHSVHDARERLTQLRDGLRSVIIINVDSALHAAQEGDAVPHTALSRPTHLSQILHAITEHVTPTDLGPLPHRASWGVTQTLDVASREYPTTTVSTLARSVGVSADYLSRTFRAEIGMPLGRYLTRVRLEASRRLLLESDLKLEAIASQVGLHDASYFSRLFLRYFGCRPGAYRHNAIP